MSSAPSLGESSAARLLLPATLPHKQKPRPPALLNTGSSEGESTPTGPGVSRSRRGRRNNRPSPITPPKLGVSASAYGVAVGGGDDDDPLAAMRKYLPGGLSHDDPLAVMRKSRADCHDAQRRVAQSLGVKVAALNVRLVPREEEQPKPRGPKKSRGPSVAEEQEPAWLTEAAAALA